MLLNVLLSNKEKMSVKDLQNKVNMQDFEYATARILQDGEDDPVEGIKKAMITLTQMTVKELEAVREVMDLAECECTDGALLAMIALGWIAFCRNFGEYCWYSDGEKEICVEVDTLRVVGSMNLGYAETDIFDNEEYWGCRESLENQDIFEVFDEVDYDEENTKKMEKEILEAISGCHATSSEIENKLTEKGYSCYMEESETAYKCDNCNYDSEYMDEEKCVDCPYSNDIFGVYTVAKEDDEVHLHIIDSYLHTFRISIDDTDYVADINEECRISNIQPAVTGKDVLLRLKQLKGQVFDEVRQKILDCMADLEVIGYDGWCTEAIISDYDDAGDYVAFIHALDTFGYRICIDDSTNKKIIRNIMLVTP